MKWQIWIITERKSSILFPVYDILTGMWKYLLWLAFCCFIYYLKWTNCLSALRFDADDCEVDSEGEDDEVNGNEDGDGEDNEEDSEEGWSRT